MFASLKYWVSEIHAVIDTVTLIDFFNEIPQEIRVKYLNWAKLAKYFFNFFAFDYRS